MAVIILILAEPLLEQADRMGPIHIKMEPLSITRDGRVETLGSDGTGEVKKRATLLKMGRYRSTTICHYWDITAVYYSVN